MPIDAANHMLAAVVRLKISFVPPFIIIPAPKNPIPPTTYAAILVVDAGSTCEDKNVNTIEPQITRV